MTTAKTDSKLLWTSPEREPVAAKIAIAGDFLPAGKLIIPEGSDWRSMARRLAEHFDDVATSFVNLESCLDAATLRPRSLSGLGDIVSAPIESLSYLEAIRCVAVGIANNHSFDYGGAGVERTKAAIGRCSMIPLGAGNKFSDSPEVFVWTGPGDIRVGFWAAATVTLDLATRKNAGVEPATLSRARQACKKMKQLGARVCVALLHSGAMRTNRPDSEQVGLMDSLAKSGFDVVAASHSHRISGYKRLDNSGQSPSFCFYGLGSIVSGFAHDPLEREGLVVVAGLSRSGRLLCIETRPVVIDASGFGTIPAIRVSREILERFAALSIEIADGSYEQQFYRDISRGLLHLYARDVKAAFRAGGVRGLARKASRVRTRHVRRLVHKVIG